MRNEAREMLREPCRFGRARLALPAIANIHETPLGGSARNKPLALSGPRKAPRKVAETHGCQGHQAAQDEGGRRDEVPGAQAREEAVVARSAPATEVLRITIRQDALLCSG